VPWFLQDLGTYGIGIFTPTILGAAFGAKQDHVRSITDLILNDILAAKGAALITMLLIVGIIFAVILADKVGRIWLQVIGFIGCAAGLLLASFSDGFEGSTKTVIIFAGFMLFNFMTNLGPNAQTYLLAGEVFPTAIRGTGAGFCSRSRQDRRGGDGVSVPDSADRHRHWPAALHPRGYVDSRRRGDVDLSRRNEWREP
jgi:MFS family permease